MNACERDELDLAPPGGPPSRWEGLPTVAAVLAKLDDTAAKARAGIGRMSDADFQKPWTLKMGGRALGTMAKLAVFLRLVGAPVPAIYGPSADEGKM
ncbi:MAG: hypothetical protein ACREMV_12150 [Gemmatimonadales bacterium]